MDKKIAIIGTIVGVLALIVSIAQLIPKNTADCGGEWKMVVKVEEADMARYIGMELEWKLHLVQNGENIKGTGEKIKVNNEKLPYAQRSRLDLNGVIDGDKFIITYVEKGLLRETIGTFTGEVNDSIFVGDFSQTASDSKGTIMGKKL